MLQEIQFHPIGIVHSDLQYRYETPRQGVLAEDNQSYIQLFPGKNFEQALKDLDGFDRIWVIYQFHLNNNWKPLVQPPRHTRNKVGVFASRAPYRPNSIGLSCVRLLKIDKLRIYIDESDILNGSPVFDIKPYLPYSDSFPDAKTGWAKSDLEQKFTVSVSPEAEAQMKWIKNRALINLLSFARLQLEFCPTDNTRKRISISGEYYCLAYRTWRINYCVDELNKTVSIIQIYSGYSDSELEDKLDNYEDKPLHLEFLEAFKK
ncbi:MAG: tRNA (N6-threonylcarbamoyladenosine(37)-N6)-methyltransferase TrmO [Ignavibacteria bacterium]|nr:tRNA (N6-threonylcarbamoyladenosine(37)-N6)-methyltransferase TrmO [Ignavibacteria bacterium]